MHTTWYTIDEVAERLKVSRWTVWRWVRAGDLTAIRFGRRWRINEDDLAGFVAEQAKKALVHA